MNVIKCQVTEETVDSEETNILWFLQLPNEIEEKHTISRSLTANVGASYLCSLILSMNSSKVCGISDLPCSSSFSIGSSNIWYITSGTYHKPISNSQSVTI